MDKHFTLEYWIDDGWYVGRIKEEPSVFSQGETLAELEDNIRDAYSVMTAEADTSIPANSQSKELVIQL